MWVPPSLQWRIAIAYTVLIFITMGAVSLYLINFISDSYMESLDDRLKQEATLIADAVLPDLTSGIVDVTALSSRVTQLSIAANARITLVDSHGGMLADSQLHDIPVENLSSQPEVRDVLNGAPIAMGSRRDPGADQDFHFVAVPVQFDGQLVGVVRIGAPTSEVQSNLNRIIIIVSIAAAIVAVLSIVLGYWVGHRVSVSVRTVTSGARLLAQGHLDHRVTPIGNDESREMADAFNQMATRIRDMVRDLEQERGRLSAVLETMVDGVVVVDETETVVLMNQAAAEMLDLSKIASGDTLAEVVRDFELQRMVQRAQQGDKVLRGEVELVSGHRTVTAVATPVKGIDSQGVLLTLHDRTTTRLLESTRKEFVTNASHELRSPLASINAMVETLEGGALKDLPTAEDYVARIHREVDRMTALMNDLLELSRLESGRLDLQYELVSPYLVVQQAVMLIQERIDLQGTLLELESSEDMPNALGEKDRLIQALFNLIENALKYTGEDGKVIISTQVHDESVVFRVTDTGAGITPQELTHVFERFYKVDRSRHTSGTGLGLAIVKHTARAHGGDVGIESVEGGGTSVWYSIPIVKSNGTSMG